jgi:hypothetical protein
MTSVSVSDGDRGIAQTIAEMKTLLNGPQGVRSWVVQRAAADAVRGTERGNPEIDSIFNWVKDNIEFRGEAGEVLQSPEATINLGMGDCDCQALLIAALARSRGYQTDFRTVAMRGSEGDYSHVYALVQDKYTGDWIPMDTTVERAYPGWEPDYIARAQDYGAASKNGGLLGRLFGMFG